MSKLVKETLGTNQNLCELCQVIPANLDAGREYEDFEIYTETSYEVKETYNDTINIHNSDHWAIVKFAVKDNSYCCLNITDTENEDSVMRLCTNNTNYLDQWNPIDQNLQFKTSDDKYIELNIKNGIGKLFIITGIKSNVQLYLQIVEEYEELTNVRDQWNFQDSGINKILVTLPINDNMDACLNFSDTFNMIEKDPIICQYKKRQSQNCFEYYPIKMTSFIRNNSSWSLNFPSDVIEICDCVCKFWSPENESLELYSYKFINNYAISNSTIIKYEEEIFSSYYYFLIFVLIIPLTILLRYIRHRKRQDHKIHQETNFVYYDAFILVNRANHDLLEVLLKRLKNGSLGKIFHTTCAERDYPVGHNNYDNLFNFLTKAKNIIIILSVDFLSSKSDLRDLREAIIFQKNSCSKLKLIPVLVGTNVWNNSINNEPVVQNYLKSINKNHLGMYV